MSFLSFLDNNPELSEKELNKYRETFNSFISPDEDPDLASIDVQNLTEIMRRMYCDPTEKEIKEMIAEVDNDGDGEIQFHEFTELLVNLKKRGKKKSLLKSAFKLFDKDGSGSITSENLYEVFHHLGCDITLKECSHMIYEVTKGKKVMNLESFKELFSKTNTEGD